MRPPLGAPSEKNDAPSTAQRSDGETADASTTPALPGAGWTFHPVPSLCIVNARRPCCVVLAPNAHTFCLPSTRTCSIMTGPNRLTLSFPVVQADPLRRSQHPAACIPQMPKAHTFAADEEPIVSNNDVPPSLLVTEAGSRT